MSLAQVVLKLYKDAIPNEVPGPDKESSKGDKDAISDITKPTLEVFLPAKGKGNGTAVIICPGGGYGINAYRHEGVLVAQQFVKAGVAAFVLKYRLPSDKTMQDKSIGPLQDAQQAIVTVRQRAKEWNIDPERIGIAGFSAGGHLASTAGTHFTKAFIDNPSKINLRPDFMILLYPVISFTDSIGHMGTRGNLIGKSPDAETIKLYSNELQVTAQTPPTFLMHAGDDDVVKVANSIRFYEALHHKKVDAQLFIYPKGGHGFGLVNPTSPDLWMDRCLDWMRSNKWL
ncbi:MAG: alpha/beta hydrolase [Chryseolinea sp.]